MDSAEAADITSSTRRKEKKGTAKCGEKESFQTWISLFDKFSLSFKTTNAIFFAPPSAKQRSENSKKLNHVNNCVRRRISIKNTHFILTLKE